MTNHASRWGTLALGVSACVLSLAVTDSRDMDARVNRIETSVMPKPILIAGEEPPRVALASFLESVPGVSVAVVDDGRIAWAKAYGVEDQRSKTPVTTETLFPAGGISKAVTALTVLRLVDAGKLDLD